MRTEKGGLVCGRVSVGPDADAETARTVATRMVVDVGADFFGVRLGVEWGPSDEPGWWVGAVKPADAEDH